MPPLIDQAICIRRWDYSESSQTVSVFLREHGVIRGLVKGARRAGSPFGGGIELLTFGEVVAYVKPGRGLANIAEWHLLKLYPALGKHLAANRAGYYMADLIGRMLNEHDPHPLLFDALRDTLAAFADPSSVASELLRFSWTLLCETGYRPRLAHDAETGLLLPQDSEVYGFSASAGGVVVDTGGSDRWRTRGETIRLLRSLDEGKTPSNTSDGDLHRAARLLAAYTRELLATEPPTMRLVFPEL